MMKLLRLMVGIGILFIFASQAAAQESTPEVTPEVTESVPPGALLDFPGPGGYTVQVMQGEVERAYGVYIPETYAEATAPVPLVVVLHAANGTGLMVQRHTGFDELAEEHTFIVAYPDGVNGFWNDGRPVDPRVNADVSDSAYIAGVITFLSTKLSIDPSRVYLTGYSMGGMMALRAGCELGDRIAAAASVASTMPEYTHVYCQNSAPMPVLFFLGTDDRSIPWTGMSRQGSGYLSAADTVAYWTAHNGCADTPTQEILPDGDPADGTRVISSRYQTCTDDADVVLYGVYFGGHTWPGRANPIGVDPGLVSQDVDATQAIWTFFSQHSLAADGE